MAEKTRDDYKNYPSPGERTPRNGGNNNATPVEEAPKKNPLYGGDYGSQYGQIDGSEFEKLAENYFLNAADSNSINAPKLQQLAAYYQHLADNEFTKQQTDTAYERSKATNQMQLLMEAGMSRQGALAALTGGSEQTAQAASAPTPLNDLTSGVDAAVKVGGSIVSALTAIYSLGASAATLPLTLQQLSHVTKTAEYNKFFAQNQYEAMLQENAYWTAYDQAVADGQEFKDPLAAMKYFREHSGDNPKYSKFFESIKDGFRGAAMNNIMNGNRNVIDNKFAEDREVARLQLERIQPEVARSEIAKNAATITGVLSSARLNDAHASVVQQYGALEAEARIDNLKGQTEQAYSTARKNNAEAYSQEMENRISQYNFELTKANTHAEMEIAAAKLTAAGDPETLEHIKNQVMQNEELADYIAAMQLYAQRATMQEVEMNPEFSKWCQFWNSPSNREGLGLYIEYNSNPVRTFNTAAPRLPYTSMHNSGDLRQLQDVYLNPYDPD